jgi:hypothetical protein
MLVSGPQVAVTALKKKMKTDFSRNTEYILSLIYNALPSPGAHAC